MSELRGNVGRLDKFLVCGWAIDINDPATSVAVRIVQGGRTLLTIQPCFAMPTLRSTLKLPAWGGPPLYHWRLWLPLSNGISPEVPFSVVFALTGVALSNGENRILSAKESLDPAFLHDMQVEALVIPTARLNGSDVEVSVKVATPETTGKTQLAFGTELIAQSTLIREDRSMMGRQSLTYNYVISRDKVLSHTGSYLPIGVVAESPPEAERERIHLAVRTLCIPKSLFDRDLLVAPLPDIENIHRVSGPRSDQEQYLIGGLTTFYQLNLLTKHYAGRYITEFNDIVDWGVGCGRVVRHLWESPMPAGLSSQSTNVIGLDIDEVNVAWCQSHFVGRGIYRLLSLNGFDLSSSSVDFLYGISVMTHLSEHHQHKWLAEISRVLRPGGIAILTVLGEASYIRTPDAIPLPFVEKFGFFDGIPDSAIGDERSDYYRASYHSRSYIKKNWSLYFEVVDFVIMANAFSQDFVVLRRRDEAKQAAQPIDGITPPERTTPMGGRFLRNFRDFLRPPQPQTTTRIE